MNNISTKLCCLIFDTCKIFFYIFSSMYISMHASVCGCLIFYHCKIFFIFHHACCMCLCVCIGKRERERERERKRPLLWAATQCVTELFRFIEKVPPFSTTNLCKESREWVGGVLTKSICVKEALVAWHQRILKHDIFFDMSKWSAASKYWKKNWSTYLDCRKKKEK